MSTIDNLETITNSEDGLEVDQNGKHNMGSLYDLSGLLEFPTLTERFIYLEIGRFSFGYCRPSTNVPSGKGFNRNASAWAKQLNISKPTFLNAIKSLVSKGYITVHRGSTFRKDGGQYPDYYSIKLHTKLQTENKIYFNLSGTRADKEAQLSTPGSDTASTGLSSDKVYVYSTISRGHYEFEIVDRDSFVPSTRIYEITKEEHDSRSISITQPPEIDHF